MDGSIDVNREGAPLFMRYRANDGAGEPRTEGKGTHQADFLRGCTAHLDGVDRPPDGEKSEACDERVRKVRP